MKKLVLGASLSLATIAILLVAAQLTGIISLGKTEKSGNAQRAEKSGVLHLVCNSVVTRYKNGLSQPPETENMTLPVGIDLTNEVGWYTGEYTISRNRKGTLTVKPEVFEVSRPAMFPRYGVMVVGEYFSVNRQTSEFRQWLAIKDGTKLDLIRGECKRAENPAR